MAPEVSSQQSNFHGSIFNERGLFFAKAQVNIGRGHMIFGGSSGLVPQGLWRMLQEEEGESGHWLNGQKKEAIFPLPPRPSPTLSSPLALLQLHLKRLKP